jgi:hypothetical protein
MLAYRFDSCGFRARQKGSLTAREVSFQALRDFKLDLNAVKHPEIVQENFKALVAQNKRSDFGQAKGPASPILRTDCSETPRNHVPNPKRSPFTASPITSKLP